jgi:hypothetical protein
MESMTTPEKIGFPFPSIAIVKKCEKLVSVEMVIPTPFDILGPLHLIPGGTNAAKIKS